MSGQKENRCPGCSRHCTEKNVRCKYGRSYFEKRKAAAQMEARGRKYKWEKYTAEGSEIWKLLLLSTEMKKALKSGEVTEAQILLELTEEEKKTINELAERIGKLIKKMETNV